MAYYRDKNSEPSNNDGYFNKLHSKTNSEDCFYDNVPLRSRFHLLSYTNVDRSAFLFNLNAAIDFLKKYIKEAPKRKQFVKHVSLELFSLNDAMQNYVKLSKKFPYGESFHSLLVSYVELENDILYNTENFSAQYQEVVEKRILYLLMNVLYDVQGVTKKLVNSGVEASAINCLYILKNVKEEYKQPNGLVESMMIKLLKKLNILDEINALDIRNYDQILQFSQAKKMHSYLKNRDCDQADYNSDDDTQETVEEVVSVKCEIKQELEQKFDRSLIISNKECVIINLDCEENETNSKKRYKKVQERRLKNETSCNNRLNSGHHKLNSSTSDNCDNEKLYSSFVVNSKNFDINEGENCLKSKSRVSKQINIYEKVENVEQQSNSDISSPTSYNHPIYREFNYQTSLLRRELNLLGDTDYLYIRSKLYDILVMLKRYIEKAPASIRYTKTFVQTIHRTLLHLHEITRRLVMITKQFSSSIELHRLLLSYVELEYDVLYNLNNFSIKYEELVEERILQFLLNVLYDPQMDGGSNKGNNPIDMSSMNTLYVLRNIREDYKRQHPLIENMMNKLLKKLNVLDQLNKLRCKNNKANLANLLEIPEFEKIYKYLQSRELYPIEDSHLYEVGIDNDDEILPCLRKVKNKQPIAAIKKEFPQESPTSKKDMIIDVDEDDDCGIVCSEPCMLKLEEESTSQTFDEIQSSQFEASLINIVEDDSTITQISQDASLGFELCVEFSEDVQLFNQNQSPQAESAVSENTESAVSENSESAVSENIESAASENTESAVSKNSKLPKQIIMLNPVAENEDDILNLYASDEEKDHHHNIDDLMENEENALSFTNEVPTCSENDKSHKNSAQVETASKCVEINENETSNTEKVSEEQPLSSISQVELENSKAVNDSTETDNNKQLTQVDEQLVSEVFENSQLENDVQDTVNDSLDTSDHRQEQNSILVNSFEEIPSEITSDRSSPIAVDSSCETQQTEILENEDVNISVEEEVANISLEEVANTDSDPILEIEKSPEIETQEQNVSSEDPNANIAYEDASTEVQIKKVIGEKDDRAVNIIETVAETMNEVEIQTQIDDACDVPNHLIPQSNTQYNTQDLDVLAQIASQRPKIADYIENQRKSKNKLNPSSFTNLESLITPPPNRVCDLISTNFELNEESAESSDAYFENQPTVNDCQQNTLSIKHSVFDEDTIEDGIDFINHKKKELAKSTIPEKMLQLKEAETLEIDLITEQQCDVFYNESPKMAKAKKVGVHINEDILLFYKLQPEIKTAFSEMARQEIVSKSEDTDNSEVKQSKIELNKDIKFAYKDLNVLTVKYKIPQKDSKPKIICKVVTLRFKGCKERVDRSTLKLHEESNLAPLKEVVQVTSGSERSEIKVSKASEVPVIQESSDFDKLSFTEEVPIQEVEVIAEETIDVQDVERETPADPLVVPNKPESNIVEEVQSAEEIASSNEAASNDTIAPADNEILTTHKELDTTEVIDSCDQQIICHGDISIQEVTISEFSEIVHEEIITDDIDIACQEIVTSSEEIPKVDVDTQNVSKTGGKLENPPIVIQEQFQKVQASETIEATQKDRNNKVMPAQVKIDLKHEDNQNLDDWCPMLTACQTDVTRQTKTAQQTSKTDTKSKERNKKLKKSLKKKRTLTKAELKFGKPNPYVHLVTLPSHYEEQLLKKLDDKSKSLKPHQTIEKNKNSKPTTAESYLKSKLIETDSFINALAEVARIKKITRKTRLKKSPSQQKDEPANKSSVTRPVESPYKSSASETDDFDKNYKHKKELAKTKIKKENLSTKLTEIEKSKLHENGVELKMNKSRQFCSPFKTSEGKSTFSKADEPNAKEPVKPNKSNIKESVSDSDITQSKSKDPVSKKVETNLRSRSKGSDDIQKGEEVKEKPQMETNLRSRSKGFEDVHQEGVVTGKSQLETNLRSRSKGSVDSQKGGEAKEKVKQSETKKTKLDGKVIETELPKKKEKERADNIKHTKVDDKSSQLGKSEKSVEKGGKNSTKATSVKEFAKPNKVSDKELVIKKAPKLSELQNKSVNANASISKETKSHTKIIEQLIKNNIKVTRELTSPSTDEATKVTRKLSKVETSLRDSSRAVNITLTRVTRSNVEVETSSRDASVAMDTKSTRTNSEVETSKCRSTSVDFKATKVARKNLEINTTSKDSSAAIDNKANPIARKNSLIETSLKDSSTVTENKKNQINSEIEASLSDSSTSVSNKATKAIRRNSEISTYMDSSKTTRRNSEIAAPLKDNVIHIDKKPAEVAGKDSKVTTSKGDKATKIVRKNSEIEASLSDSSISVTNKATKTSEVSSRTTRRNSEITSSLKDNSTYTDNKPVKITRKDSEVKTSMDNKATKMVRKNSLIETSVQDNSTPIDNKSSKVNMEIDDKKIKVARRDSTIESSLKGNSTSMDNNPAKVTRSLMNSTRLIDTKRSTVNMEIDNKKIKTPTKDSIVGSSLTNNTTTLDNQPAKITKSVMNSTTVIDTKPSSVKLEIDTKKIKVTTRDSVVESSLQDNSTSIDNKPAKFTKKDSKVETSMDSKVLKIPKTQNEVIETALMDSSTVIDNKASTVNLEIEKKIKGARRDSLIETSLKDNSTSMDNKPAKVTRSLMDSSSTVIGNKASTVNLEKIEVVINDSVVENSLKDNSTTIDNKPSKVTSKDSKIENSKDSKVLKIAKSRNTVIATSLMDSNTVIDNEASLVNFAIDNKIIEVTTSDSVVESSLKNNSTTIGNELSKVTSKDSKIENSKGSQVLKIPKSRYTVIETSLMDSNTVVDNEASLVNLAIDNKIIEVTTSDSVVESSLKNNSTTIDNKPSKVTSKDSKIENSKDSKVLKIAKSRNTVIATSLMDSNTVIDNEASLVNFAIDNKIIEVTTSDSVVESSLKNNSTTIGNELSKVTSKDSKIENSKGSKVLKIPKSRYTVIETSLMDSNTVVDNEASLVNLAIDNKIIEVTTSDSVVESSLKNNSTTIDNKPSKVTSKDSKIENSKDSKVLKIPKSRYTVIETSLMDSNTVIDNEASLINLAIDNKIIEVTTSDSVVESSLKDNSTSMDNKPATVTRSLMNSTAAINDNKASSTVNLESDNKKIKGSTRDLVVESSLKPNSTSIVKKPAKVTKSLIDSTTATDDNKASTVKLEIDNKKIKESTKDSVVESSLKDNSISMDNKPATVTRSLMNSTAAIIDNKASSTVYLESDNKKIKGSTRHLVVESSLKPNSTSIVKKPAKVTKSLIDSTTATDDNKASTVKLEIDNKKIKECTKDSVVESSLKDSSTSMDNKPATVTRSLMNSTAAINDNKASSTVNFEIDNKKIKVARRDSLVESYLKDNSTSIDNKLATVTRRNSVIPLKENSTAMNKRTKRILENEGYSTSMDNTSTKVTRRNSAIETLLKDNSLAMDKPSRVKVARIISITERSPIIELPVRQRRAPVNKKETTVATNTLEVDAFLRINSPLMDNKATNVFKNKPEVEAHLKDGSTSKDTKPTQLAAIYPEVATSVKDNSTFVDNKTINVTIRDSEVETASASRSSTPIIHIPKKRRNTIEEQPPLLVKEESICNSKATNNVESVTEKLNSRSSARKMVETITNIPKKRRNTIEEQPPVLVEEKSICNPNAVGNDESVTEKLSSGSSARKMDEIITNILKKRRKTIEEQPPVLVKEKSICNLKFTDNESVIGNLNSGSLEHKMNETLTFIPKKLRNTIEEQPPVLVKEKSDCNLKISGTESVIENLNSASSELKMDETVTRIPKKRRNTIEEQPPVLVKEKSDCNLKISGTESVIENLNSASSELKMDETVTRIPKKRRNTIEEQPPILVKEQSCCKSKAATHKVVIENLNSGSLVRKIDVTETYIPKKLRNTIEEQPSVLVKEKSDWKMEAAPNESVIENFKSESSTRKMDETVQGASVVMANKSTLNIPLIQENVSKIPSEQDVILPLAVEELNEEKDFYELNKNVTTAKDGANILIQGTPINLSLELEKSSRSSKVRNDDFLATFDQNECKTLELENQNILPSPEVGCDVFGAKANPLDSTLLKNIPATHIFEEIVDNDYLINSQRFDGHMSYSDDMKDTISDNLLQIASETVVETTQGTPSTSLTDNCETTDIFQVMLSQVKQQSQSNDPDFIYIEGSDHNYHSVSDPLLSAECSKDILPTRELFTEDNMLQYITSSSEAALNQELPTSLHKSSVNNASAFQFLDQCLIENTLDSETGPQLSQRTSDSDFRPKQEIIVYGNNNSANSSLEFVTEGNQVDARFQQSEISTENMQELMNSVLTEPVNLNAINACSKGDSKSTLSENDFNHYRYLFYCLENVLKPYKEVGHIDPLVSTLPVISFNSAEQLQSSIDHSDAIANCISKTLECKPDFSSNYSTATFSSVGNSNLNKKVIVEHIQPSEFNKVSASDTSFMPETSKPITTNTLATAPSPPPQVSSYNIKSQLDIYKKAQTLPKNKKSPPDSTPNLGDYLRRQRTRTLVLAPASKNIKKAITSLPTSVKIQGAIKVTNDSNKAAVPKQLDEKVSAPKDQSLCIIDKHPEAATLNDAKNSTTPKRNKSLETKLDDTKNASWPVKEVTSYLDDLKKLDVQKSSVESKPIVSESKASEGSFTPVQAGHDMIDSIKLKKRTCKHFSLNDKLPYYTKGNQKKVDEHKGKRKLDILDNKEAIPEKRLTTSSDADKQRGAADSDSGASPRKKKKMDLPEPNTMDAIFDRLRQEGNVNPITPNCKKKPPNTKAITATVTLPSHDHLKSVTSSYEYDQQTPNISMGNIFNTGSQRLNDKPKKIAVVAPIQSVLKKDSPPYTRPIRHVSDSFQSVREPYRPPASSSRSSDYSRVSSQTRFPSQSSWMNKSNSNLDWREKMENAFPQEFNQKISFDCGKSDPFKRDN